MTTVKNQEIDPFFLQNSVNLFDTQHFKPYTNSRHSSVRLPLLTNSSLHLEMRLWIQEQAKKYGTATFYKIVSNCTLLESFFNRSAYKKLESITFIPKLDLISQYRDYFLSTGRSLQTVSKRGRYNARMEEEYISQLHFTFTYLESFYDFTYEQIHGKPPVEGWNFKNDVWNLDAIDITKKINPSKPIHTVNFSAIKTQWIKNGAKCIMKNAIEVGRNLNTAKSYIGFAKKLDKFWREDFCRDKNPEETTASVLEDRKNFECLMRYFHKQYSKENTYSSVLHGISNFILACDALGCNGYTSKVPLLPYDSPKKVHDDPRPFSDLELSQIIKALNKSRNADSEIYKDITLLMILQGFRISDICNLEIYDCRSERCLKTSPDGTVDLMYYQQKTKKWTLCPLQPESAYIIQKWIDRSVRDFNKPVYVFQTEGNKAASTNLPDEFIEPMPVKSNNLINFLGRLVADNNILADDGKLLRIKSHSFRKTFATKFIQLTDDPVATSQMLGQKGLASLYAYVKVSANERLESMKEIHEENNELIANMGRSDFFVNNSVSSNTKKIVPPDKLDGIPLSNGCCTKKGEICKHANNCYKCKMFKPMKEYLPIYKAQLNHMEMQMSFSEIQGYPTMAKHYEETIEAIEKCIEKLEENNSDGENKQWSA